MPEVSNKSMDAFAVSICWQTGSVRSTRRLNRDCKSSRKCCLKRVNLEASGTELKPQKSRSSWENFRKIISRETVGIEKISCKSSALSIGKRRCLRGLPVEAWKWFIKDTGTISSRSMALSSRVRNSYLSLSNLFWQSVKISAKESCLYVIM